MRKARASIGIGLTASFAAGAIGVVGATAAADAPQTIPPALELPAGGLVFNARDRVVVDREQLTLALDRVEIDYVVRNTVAKPTSLLMAFPMPVIDMAGLFGADLAIPAYNPDNPTNFVGYWTTIDGIAVEPDVDVRAYAVGQADATKELKALGLPLYPLAPDLADKLAALPPSARDALDTANLIDNDNGTPVPLWSLKTVFHWRHLVPPQATIAIRHNYQPIAGSAPWSPTLKEKVAAKYCLTDADLAAIDARGTNGKTPTVYWVTYAPGHNAWLKGEAAEHALVIERPDEGKGIAATCAAGTREPTEKGFQIRSSNRSDDIEVAVLFVE